MIKNYFSCKIVFSTSACQQTGLCAYERRSLLGPWEVIGSDEWGRERDDEERATRKAANKDMKKGTHLTAVYPALLAMFHKPRIVY